MVSKPTCAIVSVHGDDCVLVAGHPLAHQMSDGVQWVSRPEIGPHVPSPVYVRLIPGEPTLVLASRAHKAAASLPHPIERRS